MPVVLYFSKINLNSDQIHEVYENRSILKNILNQLYINIQEDIEYERDDLKTVEDGITHTYSATYRFNQIEKPNENLGQSIVGTISKKAPLFFNEEHQNSGEIVKRMVENTEIIYFYFDIQNEMVAFHTTGRFGYKEFNEAFGELLKICMNRGEEYFNFNVALYKKGLKLNELKEQLRSIGNVRSLKIDIIPPNPDDDLLDNIEKNAEKYLSEIKESNITHKSILFESDSNKGINLSGKVIEEQINEIGGIHSKLTTEDALKNGYVSVSATSTEGRVYSTIDNKPVKDMLEDKPNNLIDFARDCKDKINDILRQLL